MAYDDRTMQLLPDGNHQIAEIRGTAVKRADDERRRRKDVSIMIENVMRFYFFIPTSALSCFFNIHGVWFIGPTHSEYFL
jgi:hypothetical protein